VKNAVIMHSTTKRRLAAGCLVGIGSGLFAIPLLDLYDRVDAGAPLFAAVLGNALPAILCGGLITFGVWLYLTDVDAERAVTVTRWCALSAVAAIFMMVWISAFQNPAMGASSSVLYPLGYFVIWAAVLGSVVGYYDSKRSAHARQVRAERDQFAEFFDNVPTAAVGLTFEGDDAVVHHVNDAFEEQFGFDADEMDGKALEEYLVPPEKRAEATDINERMRADEVVERKIQRSTASSFRTFVLKGIPVESTARNVDAYAIYTDITKEQEQRQRLQVLYRVLRHDLRNRMNVVKGNAEIILERLSDPKLREWAESLTASADELIDLSSQTREIERSLDAGDYSRRTIHAADVVDDVVDRVADRYPGVAVDRNVDEGINVVANDLIDTAIENAVENAFEHNEGAEQSVRVTVRPVDENYAEIVVADDGPGIPDSERQLFDGGSEITQLQHASGLGLWLLNWIVTQSGGSIDICDNEPRGTVVVIRLPRDLRDPVEASQPVEVA
jgi:PAS domain S-box-containing protein